MEWISAHYIHVKPRPQEREPCTHCLRMGQISVNVSVKYFGNYYHHVGSFTMNVYESGACRLREKLSHIGMYHGKQEQKAVQIFCVSSVYSKQATSMFSSVQVEQSSWS